VTETRKPPRCHYDRALHQRVTNDHRDDCPTVTGTGTGDCLAAGRGCAPCSAPHCLVCGREHLDNDHPNTCPDCIGKVRNDLAVLQTLYTALHLEAIEAGNDGRLVAAAPIPGGNAAVLIGPTVRLDVLRVSRVTSEVHRRSDPLPPLAVLAQWEDMYRAWFAHTRARRASVAGAIAYLTDQLPHMAQATAGPDWVTFTHQTRDLRAQLEHALHDEREPEIGVECFECGDRLVRRFRDPKRCRHTTPARTWFHQGIELARLGYPELMPNAAEARAARQPCGRCAQGGLDDPQSGRSWECPGCRKDYGVDEYVNAVRSALVSRSDASAWCTMSVAAENAQDITGRLVTPKIVRAWIERDGLPVRCPWRPGQRFGMQEVFWPDVLERASERRSRGPSARAS
jgi:hypothetical protein